MILAGTSGYSYKEWKGSFYPEKLAADDMLSHYAAKLPAVEINNTFYRLPRASVLETWAAAVPPEFRFAIKASRRITHLKRLKEVSEETNYLLDTVAALGDRLGVVLYQLPPNLKKDLDRLDAFLSLLRPGVRSAFEFRHATWLDDEVFARLREHRCALCLAEEDDEPAPAAVSTAPFGYLRLRKALYSDDALRAWAGTVAAQGWDDAYVFFKHEDGAAGPAFAGKFLELAATG